MPSKNSASKSFAGSFTSSPQGRVALMVAIIYTASTFLFGLCPGHIAGGMLKLSVLVYTINCIVSGSCHTLGWVHVLALVIFCASDLASLIHVDRHLASPGTERSAHGLSKGISGVFGAKPAATYGEARARMDRA
jgi:hypothetical protein